MSQHRAHPYPWLAAGTLILLAIAASRILRLAAMPELATDEIWSIWQTFGTPGQVLAWTPYDWPPLYFLLLGGWRALVGLHPVVLRYFALLVFLLAGALTFRVMRRLGVDRSGALLGMAAYAALGYAIFVSVYVRGYMLVACFAPLALWLALRYFARPGLRRALPLGITLAAMFWTTFSTVGAFVALGLFTLVVYGRQVWRWWLPGLIAAALALPQILSKAALSVSRLDSVATQQLPPLGQALAELYSAYTANAPLVWAAILIVAALLLIARGRRQWRVALGLLAWVLTPILLYAFNDVLGLFNTYRYVLWVLVGLGLWAGLGLALLPRPGRAAAGALLVALMFLPIPTRDYEYFFPPYGENFAWLADHLQAGDVILLDPNCACASADEWEYYARVYFPDQGLQFVDAPEGHRRVWYVTWQSYQDPDLEARVNAGRKPGIFVGPPENLFRLYEGPPDAAGIPFANGIRFHGLEFPDARALPVRHEGEPLAVRLWWSADAPLEADYSFSLQVFHEDALVIQLDGPALVDGTALESSRWTPGELVVDSRTLEVPAGAVRGEYVIRLAVYQWWDGVRIAAPGVDDNTLLTIGRFAVFAW